MASCYVGNVGCEHTYNIFLSLDEVMVFKRTQRQSENRMKHIMLCVLKYSQNILETQMRVAKFLTTTESICRTFGGFLTLFS